MIHYTRTGHARRLREIAIELFGIEEVAPASDGQVAEMLSEDGWCTYLHYTGEYDDEDYLLLIRKEAIDGMIADGDAKAVNR